MSDFEMRVGLRHFLHGGGAEGMDADELIPIKLKCEQVLSDKKIPSAKVVHFLDSSKRAKSVACGGFFYRRDITDNNSTDRVAYVSCASCKATVIFRNANGEDVSERKPVVHLVKRERLHHIFSDGYYTSILSVCSSSAHVSGKFAAKTPADVTCKKCLKTETYTKRVAAYNKRKAKKEAVSV